MIGALPCSPAYLIRVPMVPELFDVVHHAIELPLPIDLAAPAQREAVEPLVAPQVSEHRFDGGKARADHLLALVGVDAPLHPVGAGFIAITLAPEEGDLSYLGLVRRAQTSGALVARHTVAGVLRGSVAVDRAVAAVAIQPLAGRAWAVPYCSFPGAIERKPVTP